MGREDQNEFKNLDSFRKQETLFSPVMIFTNDFQLQASISERYSRILFINIPHYFEEGPHLWANLKTVQCSSIVSLPF